MHIDRLDHLVLTIRDVEATCEFYERVMQMRAVTFAAGRRALTFGSQKLNLHPANAPISPHASRPTAGSADLCFITTTPIAEVVAHLQRLGVDIEEGRCAEQEQRDRSCPSIFATRTTISSKSPSM